MLARSDDRPFACRLELQSPCPPPCDNRSLSRVTSSLHSTQGYSRRSSYTQEGNFLLCHNWAQGDMKLHVIGHDQSRGSKSLLFTSLTDDMVVWNLKTGEHVGSRLCSVGYVIAHIRQACCSSGCPWSLLAPRHGSKSRQVLTCMYDRL